VQADLHKGGVHAGEHVGHFALEDAPDDPFLALDVQLDQAAVLQHGDPCLARADIDRDLLREALALIDVLVDDPSRLSLRPRGRTAPRTPESRSSRSAALGAGRSLRSPRRRRRRPREAGSPSPPGSRGAASGISVDPASMAGPPSGRSVAAGRRRATGRKWTIT